MSNRALLLVGVWAVRAGVAAASVLVLAVGIYCITVLEDALSPSHGFVFVVSLMLHIVFLSFVLAILSVKFWPAMPTREAGDAK